MNSEGTFPCGRTRQLKNDFVGVAEFQMQRIHTPSHAHDRPAIAVGITGRIEIDVDGRSSESLTVGTMLPIPAGLVHRERAHAEPSRCLLLTCSLPSIDRAEPRTLTSPAVAVLGRLLAESLEGGDLLGLEASTCELLALTELDLARRSVSAHATDWVGRITRCLDDRYRHPPPLAELADAAGVSREHLARVFRRTTGLTVGQYVRRRRVLEGASRLRQRRADLSDVALTCGFADQSHFTREFRKHFRTTPRRYRQLVGRG